MSTSTVRPDRRDPTSVPVVFIIDDDPSVRRALSRLLRAEGFQVETFSSGDEFLHARAYANSGCVVLDMRMPGLSGFEVMERIAARRPALPVILITGHGDVPMATRALSSGCASFLAKPFEDEELLHAVRRALRQNPATEA
ncbi:MAG TPA: response regulator transcription factor [Vicinamibacterales bacterium]|nr:response regulator transcription factor [Vicinamibacterales bacterium]